MRQIREKVQKRSNKKLRAYVRGRTLMDAGK